MRTRVRPLTKAEIYERLRVDADGGRCYWIKPSKYNPKLQGEEAGYARLCAGGKYYWVIKIDSCAYKRSQIILMCKTGLWPSDTVDHKDGNSLNDKCGNLRHATYLENSRNQKNRAKKSILPMGVNALQKGFGARIQDEGKSIWLGVFPTPEGASAAYRAKRIELFGAFA